MDDDQVVTGWHDPAFAPVAGEFARKLEERGEHGAAVCVTVHGTVVADLQGGWPDRQHRRPWSPDTPVNMFSVGKGLTAACLARLTEAGLLAAERRRRRTSR